MSQNKDHIYGVLDLFTQASVLDEPERGAGFHIFFDLRNNYHARLTFAENLSLFYHYKSFEKCLGLMRKRELKTSELIFNEIHESGLDYPFFLKDGMVSLFYAMAAYREYAFGRYDAAIAKLQTAIKHAESQGADYPVFLCEIAEQWLNIVRVHIRVKDEPSIVEETQKILAFLFTGFYTDASVGQRYLTLSQKDHNQALIHVINSIYMGLERLVKGDPGKIDGFFSQICCGLEPHLQKYTVNKYMSDSILLMNLYYKGDTTGFLRNMACQFEAVQNTTRSLQKLIFTAYINICRQHDLSLQEHRNFPIFRELMAQHFAISLKSLKTEDELSALSAIGV